MQIMIGEFAKTSAANSNNVCTTHHTPHTTHHTPHTTRHTPHAARRTPHALHHTPHAAHRTPHAPRPTPHAARPTPQVHTWCVVCGVRRVACGVWCVVCGVRRVACGVRSAGDLSSNSSHLPVTGAVYNVQMLGSVLHHMSPSACRKRARDEFSSPYDTYASPSQHSGFRQTDVRPPPGPNFGGGVPGDAQVP